MAETSERMIAAGRGTPKQYAQHWADRGCVSGLSELCRAYLALDALVGEMAGALEKIARPGDFTLPAEIAREALARAKEVRGSAGTMEPRNQ